jgi:hypothetical protein
MLFCRLYIFIDIYPNDIVIFYCIFQLYCEEMDFSHIEKIRVCIETPNPKKARKYWVYWVFNL